MQKGLGRVFKSLKVQGAVHTFRSLGLGENLAILQEDSLNSVIRFGKFGTLDPEP